MSENDNKDFWDLSDYAKKKPYDYQRSKPFSKSATSAVDITDSVAPSDAKRFPDASSESQITRFIPPHKSTAKNKSYLIKEYQHPNPLIESIKLISEKENDTVFPETNLFIREREALLSKVGTECAYTPYYSFSPRYSQMSRAQLKWYIWWRENARNGVFLKTDDSYITLYVYELAAAQYGEDKQKALDMLCALMREYSIKNNYTVLVMAMRDIICDFCLIHELSAPSELLENVDHRIFAGAYLPEFFIDLAKEKRGNTVKFALRSLSLYDYKRSKLYTPETAELFENSIEGALISMVSNENAYNALFSFTEGIYGCVTAVHKPFSRMTNIVNRSVSLEIKYYQLSNLQSSITDAARYAENKLREHMGVKSKLNIITVNPHIKNAVDEFFSANYPAMSIPDRRKKNALAKESEAHEYDKLYDVPKAEFSAEHALEIERESWNTTKILTEAFEDSAILHEHDISNKSSTIDPTENQTDDNSSNDALSLPDSLLSFDSPKTNCINDSQVKSDIYKALGEKAEFIELCKTGSALEQRKFALSLKLSTDELADITNETAVEIFGDIILENNGEAYRIIEDYQDLF